MKCPQCDTENPLGVTYCVGCGAKLELTDAAAHMQAVAAVRHDNWQEAFKAMNRTLYVFLIVFIVSLIYRAYATREVVADFSADAPLPPPPPLVLTSEFIELPELPAPEIPRPVSIKPDKDKESEILQELALSARSRVNCIVHLKTGAKIAGFLLRRTAKEFHVIEEGKWGPPVRPTVIPVASIGRPQLPSDIEDVVPFPP